MEPTLKERYVDTGRVRLVWHDFPWIGEESRTAAQAARCAGAQGNARFWEYHDYLYAHQAGYNRGQFSPGNLKAFAAELGLDTTAFNGCLDAGADLPALRQALQDAGRLGVTSTPSFTMNGGRRFGFLTVQQLTTLLDAELARLGG